MCCRLLSQSGYTYQLSGKTSSTKYNVVDVSNGGTIRGVVILRGNSPSLSSMEITKDSKVCGRSTPSPRLSLGKNKGVRNAIIYLAEIREGKKLTNEKIVLDQQGCIYEPHVLILPLGSQLEIVNSDPILHNVHAYDLQNRQTTVFNIAQPIKGQRTPIKPTMFKHPGLFLTTCDAGHPWMSSYIWVVDHPYHVITDADGAFVLEQVPPGSYTLKMWHEGIRITKTEMENGSVKNYLYEEPYELEHNISVPANGEEVVQFEIVLR